MKIIVQFSGGKDSLAALLYTIENITKTPEIVFCDTGFESAETYQYIKYVEKFLNLPIITIQSSKYHGMVDLATRKKRFPSTNARFCTEELKIKPMIDYVLDKNTDFLTIQGIRAQESFNRSKMNPECTFFKYYFEPYTNNITRLAQLQRKKEKKQKDLDKIKKLIARIEQGKMDDKYHTYRKKEVFAFCKTKANDILRPVFKWTAGQVIDYIKSKGMELNPLYKKGFKRVGCFPCIMSSHIDIRCLKKYYPERISELSDIEKTIETSFFPPDYIPKKHCTNKKYPIVADVVEYLTEHTLELFPDERSCVSFYNICE